MQASTTSAKNTASKPPHRYVAAVPSAAVMALNSDSRSNETTSAVGIKKRPTRGAKKPPGRRHLAAIQRSHASRAATTGGPEVALLRATTALRGLLSYLSLDHNNRGYPQPLLA